MQRGFPPPTQTCEDLSAPSQFSDVPALVPVVEVFVLCGLPTHALRRTSARLLK